MGAGKSFPQPPTGNQTSTGSWGVGGHEAGVSAGEGSDRRALEAARREIAQLQAQVADLQEQCTSAVPKHGRTDERCEERGTGGEGDAAHVAVPQVAVSGVSVQGEQGNTTNHCSTSATDRDLSIWKELFHKLNRSGDGKLSLEELEPAVQGEPEMTRLMDRKLRDLLAQLHQGEKTGVDLPDFAAVMKERFERSFALFFESAGVPALLTSAAWKHVVGDGGCEALLQEESEHMHCFQSLRHKTREERVNIFSALLNTISGPLASQLADAVAAASECDVAQQQAAAGKFRDMTLGHPLCFEIGIDALGFMDLDCEAAISREHASTARFKAWNNDMERETSPAEQLQLVLENGWAGKINNKDYRGNVMCEDFETHAMTKAASLLKAELVMLRLYTGPMYKLYNTLLRDLLHHVKQQVEEMTGATQEVTTAVVRVAFAVAREKLAGRSYTTSVLVLVSALVKLRTVSDLPPNRKVFRGVSGLNVPDCFKDEDERGNRGGIEFGFCSTSASRAQAIGYINFDKGMPQLYEMEVGQIDRGASVKWISFFPAEEEVLLPPLCSIEAVGNAKYEEVEVLSHGTEGASAPTKRTVMVWPMRLNVNLKGKTVEEHQATRKTLHTQMAENAHRELAAEIERQLAPSQEAAGAQEVAEGGPMQELAREIRAQSTAVVEGYRDQAEEHFNADAGYSAAIQDVLQLKPWAERMLALAREGATYGLTPAQLQALQIKDHLPSADMSSTTDTAFFKALKLVCAQRGLFKEHAEEADANGFTPLARVCFLGPQQDFELLLKSGARVEVLAREDGDGQTLLHSAVKAGRSEAVARLINSKCDVNKADKSGRTALALASHVSIVEGVDAVVRLIEAKCDLDTVDIYGVTPLYAAADVGALDTVVRLIEAKCDVEKSAPDFQGIARGTPLRIAAEKGHVEVLKVLLKASAGKTVQAVDGTELHIAKEQVEDQAVLAALAAKWIEDAQGDRMFV